MQILPELTPDGDYLTIHHFHRRFGIHCATGEIVALNSSVPVLPNEKLNIYTLFHYASPLAHFQDRWVPFEYLRNTSPFASAFKNGVIKPFARTFDGHADQLANACEALGGIRLPHSDVGINLR